MKSSIVARMAYCLGLAETSKILEVLEHAARGAQ
jgi:hypothetical protein